MKKVKVQVKPNSKHESVELGPSGEYLVRVNAPPVEGKANERVQALLAKHFGVAKSRVRLKTGGKSKLKIFEIDLE
ncbi:MAG TPA: hypothetical protein DCL41_10820 [Bdellovibrionales bacterium]|nr:hypothetical protein [Pseudobdellovibrionaceae bacterium]HAG92358.1 hypothetical protein [Bdellovibrionales bacterium]